MWGLDKNAGFTVSRSLFSLEWTKMCDPGGEARGFRFAGGYGGLIEGAVSGVITTSRESVVDG